jgi:cytochrome c6
MNKGFCLGMVFCCVMFSSLVRAESDPAVTFKNNCVLCHSANGSGESPVGKAMHAKDLRSAEVQAESDGALSEVIAKGKGKMPAFGAKIPAGDLGKMVEYVRGLGKKP